MQVKVALPTRCTLGEGAHWDAQRGLLWFVDVYGPHVYWFDPDSGEHGRRVLPEPVGWVLSIADSGDVILGLKSGIALLDPFIETSPIVWVDKSFPVGRDQRLNDAKCDERGRIWYGSLSESDESRPVGCLASYEASRRASIIVERGYRVTNGPAFDMGCRVMLHNDSGLRRTYRYEYDLEAGEAKNRVLWKQFSEDDGSPDGMNFDAEGRVWIAHWGTGRVCRYSFAGERLLSIEMPTSNVTNVCFGGRGLDRLFITSATRGLNPAQNKSQTHAGALFEIAGLDVRGLPSSPFRS
jgi:sugar lactone lactonase YvrE